MSVEGAVAKAVAAALAKKASDVVTLDLRKECSFTDYFVIASGGNQKHLKAIADAIDEALRGEGLRPAHVEGYPKREWILLDYSSFLVHIFTPRSRSFYDLERLWGAGTVAESPA